MTLPTRITDRIDATGVCWEWTGSTVGRGYETGDGYGTVYYEGKPWRVHRLFWTLLVGPIPDGLVTDHLCLNKVCCNPDHMEIVTPQENTRRARGSTMERCKRLHRGELTTYADGKTYCMRCNREKRRKNV